MVGTTELYAKWLVYKRIVLRLCYLAILQHLTKHRIPSSQSLVGETDRIVHRRILRHTHKHSSLRLGKSVWNRIKIYPRSRLYSHRKVQEVELVEIHGYYFLLGVLAFQLGCNHPFLELSVYKFQFAHLLPREKHFCKLLRNRTSTALCTVACNNSLENTWQRLEVDTAMLVETDILGCNKSINYVRRN